MASWGSIEQWGAAASYRHYPPTCAIRTPRRWPRVPGATACVLRPCVPPRPLTTMLYAVCCCAGQVLRVLRVLTLPHYSTLPQMRHCAWLAPVCAAPPAHHDAIRRVLLRWPGAACAACADPTPLLYTTPNTHVKKGEPNTDGVYTVLLRVLRVRCARPGPCSHPLTMIACSTEITTPFINQR